METVPVHSSLDRSLSSHKSHIGNRRRIHQSPPFISRPYENVFPSMGILQTPPPFFFHSYPPYTSPLPPLLPLPPAPLSRGLSCPTVNNQSLTRKKLKAPTKKVERKSPKRSPDQLSKNVARVSPPELKDQDDINGSGNYKSINVINHDMIPDSMVFTISPPPSSLPVPSFCLRPKHSCKAEAAGVDAGATDNIRRLLRLG